MSTKGESALAMGMVGGWCVLLAVMISCTAPAPQLPIFPPGFTTSQIVKNTPLAVRTAVVTPPPSTIMLTCDFGDGPRDGEHIYIGKQVGTFPTMLTFPATNEFVVECDNDTPSFIEIRSFVNWPPPYIVQTWTNDDASTYNTTNFWREGPINGDPVVADFVFVPTGCLSIALLNYGTNLVVAGWAVGGKVYQILSAPTVDTPLTNWQTNATFTGTNGSYQVPVGQGGDQGYYRSMAQ